MEGGRDQVSLICRSFLPFFTLSLNLIAVLPTYLVLFFSFFFFLFLFLFWHKSYTVSSFCLLKKIKQQILTGEGKKKKTETGWFQ